MRNKKLTKQRKETVKKLPLFTHRPSHAQVVGLTRHALVGRRTGTNKVGKIEAMVLDRSMGPNPYAWPSPATVRQSKSFMLC